MNAIESFLDAADEVLNSNTFLVRIFVQSGDIMQDLRIFVASGGLQQALQEADIARGWFNLQQFAESGEPEPIPGCVVKDDFRLTKKQCSLTASEYLRAMLKGDRQAGNFISFYQHARTPEEANRLTSALLGQLFEGNRPSLQLLEPDFLWNGPEELNHLHYFEGCGCDNAALLMHGSTAYLLLTNGLP